MPPVPARESARVQLLPQVRRPSGQRCASCGTELPAGSRFCNKCGQPTTTPADSQRRFASPETYTPKHLAAKILTSKSALDGERKHITVLFADVKGSMELLADRDPEEARKLLDPVLEQMADAVRRYEGVDDHREMRATRSQMYETARQYPFLRASRWSSGIRMEAGSSSLTTHPVHRNPVNAGDVR